MSSKYGHQWAILDNIECQKVQIKVDQKVAFPAKSLTSTVFELQSKFNHVETKQPPVTFKTEARSQKVDQLKVVSMRT